MLRFCRLASHKNNLISSELSINKMGIVFDTHLVGF